MSTLSPEILAAATKSPPRWYAHPYNRAELYRLASAVAWLPRPARLELARRLGRLAGRLLPAERAVMAQTLGIITEATGRRLEALIAAVFGNFAMCFSDLIAASRQPAQLRGYLAAVTGNEHVHRLKRGVISLTAHVGNWDLAGRLLAEHAARPTHIVVAVEEARALEGWVRRDGNGVRFVQRSRPTMSLNLVTALRRGEAVALQGDRALGSRGDVWVPFFGRPAPFPVGPFRLARATGAPVVPAFCTLEPDRRYAITVLAPRSVGAGEEEAALGDWVAQLEQVARAKPTQWFNFFDIWNPFRA